MNDPAHSPPEPQRLYDQVFSARLEAIEARMDRLVATIDALIRRMDERFTQIDVRFAQIDARFVQAEARMTHIESTIGGLPTTIVVTAIGALIGVAAFHATVLNNMLVSFESGRNVSASQAPIQRQAEETATLLRQIQQGLPLPAKQ